MSAYLRHRFMCVASGFAMLMTAVTVLTGILPKEVIEFLPVAGEFPSVTVVTLLLTVFVIRQMLFVVRFRRSSALDASVTGDAVNESGQNGNRLLRIPAGRRIGEACFMGVVFFWMSVLAIDGPIVRETGPVWPWLAVSWTCHVLVVVSKVERANDVMIFRTTIGKLSIPVRLLRSVRVTQGSRHYLHFKFRCGTVHVLNPNYPAANIDSIKSSLGIDGF
jgi:hypothetical protein